MKLNKKLIALSLSLWLSTITSTSLALDDTILKKGKQAPFNGVLVPESHYKEYSTAMEVQDFYTKTPQACPACADCPPSQESAFAFAGMALGLFIGLMVHK